MGRRNRHSGRSPFDKVQPAWLNWVLTCFRADCILTLGGGSITDACKLSALLLENLASPIKREDIPPLINPMNKTPPEHIKQPTFPMIFVPTTLSAGEYHSHAGCLDIEARTKKQFSYPGMVPRWIICDAELASRTPQWVWLSTGTPLSISPRNACIASPNRV